MQQNATSSTRSTARRAGLGAATFVLALAATRVAPAALRRIEFDQLTEISIYIVCGEVIELRSYWTDWGARGQVMMTDVRIRVDDVWKDAGGMRPGVVRGAAAASGASGSSSASGPTGEPPTASDATAATDRAAGAREPLREITLQFLGGAIGERWQHCPESPRYEKGERVLAFVRDLDGRLWTTGWLQGKYAVRTVKASAAATVDIVEGHPELPLATQALAEARARVAAVEKRRLERVGGAGTATGTGTVTGTGAAKASSPEGAR